MSFQNNRPSAEHMNILLGVAGKQLGKNPNELRASLEGGKLDEVLGSLDPQKAAQVQGILNDPARLESLLNSPQLKTLLASLMK